jgi:hypothetical protein
MAQTQLTRHPGRAAVWGFFLGLGVAVYMTFVWPIIGLDSISGAAIKIVLVVAAVMVVSMIWGLAGPARKPKGQIPTYAQAPAYAIELPPPALEAESPPPAADEPPPAPQTPWDAEEPPQG